MKTKLLIACASFAALFAGQQWTAAQDDTQGGLGYPGGLAPVVPASVMPGQQGMGYLGPAGPGGHVLVPAAALVPQMVPVNAAFGDGGGPGYEGAKPHQRGDCDGCADKGCPTCCAGWCHKVIVFGEFLHLRPRSSEVAYAVEVNSAVAPPTPAVQIGPVGVADMDYQPGYRIGVGFILDPCSSMTLQWARLEASTFDEIERQQTVNSDIISLLVHPSTQAANDGAEFASAAWDIEFDLADLDYRELYSYSPLHEVRWLVGVRYARLEQQLAHRTDILGDQTVMTDIDFEGGGLRLGLEGERFARHHRLFVYGKGHASFVAGRFTADYAQGRAFDRSVVDTSWEAGRIVPILDLEAGFGWESKCGNWRLTAGYVFSGWYNTVKTDRWIDAVRRNNFVGLDDSLTFDGLVTRLEARF